MVNATPGHIRNVQQAVDAAEINKGTVIGQVLDDTLNFLTFRKCFESVRTHTFPLLFKENTTREDDVTASFVQLDNLEVEARTEQLLKITDRTQVNLGTGQKGIDTDIDCQATFNAPNDLTFNNRTFFK